MGKGGGDMGMIMMCFLAMLVRWFAIDPYDGLEATA